MKRKFKAFAAIIILALLLFATVTTSYAYTDSSVADGGAGAADNGDAFNDTGKNENTDGTNGVGAANNKDTVNEYAEEDETEAKNVFTSVFNQIKSYATEIFCAMTFIGSLILAYAYKKGLIPLVEKTLISIGGAVSKIREKTESGALATEKLGEDLLARLEDSETVIKALVDRIGSMNDDLASVKSSELERNEKSNELSVIIMTQIDMLHDIFMTSALPQYQKDAVGERVAKMKEALAKNGKTE